MAKVRATVSRVYSQEKDIKEISVRSFIPFIHPQPKLKRPGKQCVL